MDGWQRPLVRPQQHLHIPRLPCNGFAAEAISFQNHCAYQEVSIQDGSGFYPRVRRELNSFLGTWLKNLLAQGFDKARAEMIAEAAEPADTIEVLA